MVRRLKIRVFKLGVPYWLQEIIKKGRFKDRKNYKSRQKVLLIKNSKIKEIDRI